MRLCKEQIPILCLLIVFVIIGTTSCDLKSSKLNSNPFLKNFYEGKTRFQDSLVNHFPIKIDNSVLAYNSSHRNSPEEIRYLTLLKKISPNDKDFINSLVAAEDTSIIEIYLYRNTYEYYNKEPQNNKEYSPVPDFGIFISDLEKPKDIKYYMLEKSNKTIFNHDLYLRYYLPPEWTNGFSRGIGVSESKNLIFYWTILW